MSKTGIITCPFEIIIDSREQQPYAFEDLYSGPSGRSPRLLVPTRRAALETGDYQVFGYPRGIIERKSKADLYSSISQRRENFVERLERMCDASSLAAVVVESSWEELLSSPPPHTKFSPKSLARTIQAWMVRYGYVHWIMLPSRAHAEAFTFRLLERHWKDEQDYKDRPDGKPGMRWSRETLRTWDRQLAGETLETNQ